MFLSKSDNLLLTCNLLALKMAHGREACSLSQCIKGRIDEPMGRKGARGETDRQIDRQQTVQQSYLDDVQDYVLVEAVKDALGNTVVVPSSVNQQQILQVLELGEARGRNAWAPVLENNRPLYKGMHHQRLQSANALVNCERGV